MRGFPAIGLLLPCLLTGCTGALEHQVAELQKRLRELSRLGSASQVRQEEMANRLLLVEDEIARRRVAGVSPPASATPAPAPAAVPATPPTAPAAQPAAAATAAKPKAADP